MGKNSQKVKWEEYPEETTDLRQVTDDEFEGRIEFFYFFYYLLWGLSHVSGGLGQLNRTSRCVQFCTFAFVFNPTYSVNAIL